MREQARPSGQRMVAKSDLVGDRRIPPTEAIVTQPSLSFHAVRCGFDDGSYLKVVFLPSRIVVEQNGERGVYHQDEPHGADVHGGEGTIGTEPIVQV
jgi:hypothetical protein